MRRTTRILGAAAATGLTLALASCASADNAVPKEGAGGSAGAGGPVTVGIKFDQPGLGQQVGSDFKGFDVKVAKYVAKELGYTDVTFKEAPSAQRETLLQSGQVKMIFATYSITDDRKQKVSFGGPYFVAGQDLLVKADDTAITGPDALDGKKLCSVTGSTSAKTVQDQFADTVPLQEYDTYSKCVEALNSGRIDAVTPDNVILAGFAAQPQYQGKLKVVGKTFSTEKYGVGLMKGDTATCEKVNAAITKMVSDGSWQKALDDTVGPDFKPAASATPPKPEPCS